MPKFSIKDLMVATLLVAFGLGISLTIIRSAHRGDAWAEHASMFWLYELGWTGTSMGVVYPLKRIIPLAIAFLIGAIIGVCFAILTNPWTI